MLLEREAQKRSSQFRTDFLSTLVTQTVLERSSAKRQTITSCGYSRECVKLTILGRSSSLEHSFPRKHILLPVTDICFQLYRRSFTKNKGFYAKIFITYKYIFQRLLNTMQN